MTTRNRFTLSGGSDLTITDFDSDDEMRIAIGDDEDVHEMWIDRDQVKRLAFQLVAFLRDAKHDGGYM